MAPSRHGRLPIEPGAGVLTGKGGPAAIPRRVAVPGLVVEVASGSFVGRVVTCDAASVELEDRRGRRRHFELVPGAFLVDDRRVELTPAHDEVAAPAQLGRTASGSLPVPQLSATTARASRIWVEGIHDAELLEQVWGDDLRAAGVVVEPLHGADDLPAAVARFAPCPQRRLGVLLDHLVEGSKESRLAAEVRDPNVLITGHRHVDVWAAIDPSRLGRAAWPDVPRGEDYKAGLARRLGFTDPGEAWRALRAAVRDWRDLDRSLNHAVERLLDHVIVPDAADGPASTD